MKNNLFLSSILLGSLVFGTAAFAGNPGQCGNQKGNHGGFISKVKKSFQKGYKAGKVAGTKVFDASQNKVADSGVALKKAVTGKKNKTFVAGHYSKKGVHVKGHFRKVAGK